MAFELPTLICPNPALKSNGDGGYACTNEDLPTHLKLLDKERVKADLAGGIASGGEIPFFTLLPRADRVVVADHSYRSIAVLFLKAAMIAKLGPRATKALIFDSNADQFYEACKALEQYIPQEIRAKGMKVAGNWPTILGQGDHFYIKGAWEKIPEKLIDELPMRLKQLTVIYGDICELLKHGKFQLLYMSNAHEHSRYDIYNGRPISLVQDYTDLLAEGGKLLLTGGQSSSLPGHLTSTLTEKAVATASNNAGSWKYWLLDKPIPAPAPAPTPEAEKPELATAAP